MIYFDASVINHSSQCDGCGETINEGSLVFDDHYVLYCCTCAIKYYEVNLQNAKDYVEGAASNLTRVKEELIKFERKINHNGRTSS